MARIYEARTVRSMLRDHERAIRQQAMVSKLQRTGLSVPDAQVTAVDGDLQAESFEAGVTGWRLQAGGNAEFNDLTLRGGIIGNDALTNPVVPGVVNLATDNIPFSASFVERAGIDLTVPSGCTRLLASTSAWISAYNNNTTGGSDGTGADYLYVYCRIGSTSGKYNPTGISGNGGTASATAGYAQLLTGLTPGDTVRIGAWCSSQYTTISASAYNYVSLTGTLNWLR